MQPVLCNAWSVARCRKNASSLALAVRTCVEIKIDTSVRFVAISCGVVLLLLLLLLQLSTFVQPWAGCLKFIQFGKCDHVCREHSRLVSHRSTLQTAKKYLL